ncbi:MAG: protein kinase [Planctomycetota bacterium]
MNNQSLGPYDLREPVGRGGMGTVYLAFNRDTGQKAAVKVLAPAFAADMGFRERFEAEVKSLEQLKHPNIVELYGYGEQDGALFYAMELVEGTSLHQELANGRRFDWRDVTHIGIEICAALKHAHDHGVIHRDIKPANLLYSNDGKVKLLDFGIAKLFGNTQITVDGGILGTADYMSPEQAEGIGATSKSDLYSVGGVLFCLMAGRPPFRGRSMAEVIHKVQYEDPPSLCNLNTETPKELELIIAQLLSKSPEDRVPTARALSNRLKAIQNALTVREEAEEGGILPIHGDAKKENTITEEEFANLETVVEGQQGPSDDKGMGADAPVPGSANVRTMVGATGTHATQAPTHFTTVDEEHRRRHTITDEKPEESLWSRVGVIGMLIGALGLLFFIVFQLRKPPTANQIFSKIQFAASQGTETLAKETKWLDEFSKRFPDEARNEQIEDYQKEVDLHRLERQLEITARLRNASRTLAPVEQAVVDAIRKESLNPEAAARDFRAIINLFSTDEDATDRERQCILLAKRNYRRLQARIDRDANTYVNVLLERLEYARKKTETEPSEGQQLLRDLIHLYSDKGWAKEVVEKARAILDQPVAAEVLPRTEPGDTIKSATNVEQKDLSDATES